MDRNDLLTATRSEFLSAFSKAFAEQLPQSLDRMFSKADQAPSSRDQRRLLDAHALVQARSEEMIRFAHANMEQLINRSFRTAYSTFRPHFPAALTGNTLSLVDSTAFEGELKVDEITMRYRNAAEEQLRDLNIRMAILFDQDDIKERENPFRPYLFSRCIINTVEMLAASAELGETVIEQLRDDMTDHVVSIYGQLNDLLAEHGIAAELRLRIQREQQRPMRGAGPAGAEVAEAMGQADLTDGPISGWGEQAWSQAGGAGQAGYGMATGAQGPMGNAMPDPYAALAQAQAAAGQRAGGGRVDQLLNWVRQGASGGAAFDSRPASSYPEWVDDGPPPGLPSGQAPLQGGRGAGGGWLGGIEAVGSALRQFFSVPARPSASNSPLAASIQGLQQNSPSIGEMTAADGSLRNLILELRPGLGNMASDVDEEMTIDIVAMLFEFILRDSQVPAEVRAQLGRLQFLVLKVALQDPTLLTQKHHPARILVNRIGSISLGLHQAGTNSEAVIAEIQRIIERLLGEVDHDAALFSQMLDEFDAFIARQLRSSDEQIERAVRVLESAESNTLRFARTTATIADALSALTLDPYLHDFLVNGWAHAIERVERRDATAAIRYRQLVPDLIWSIAPKVSKEERGQLLGQIPQLLATLREGLALTAWNAQQQQELLAWLIDAHTHALRAGPVGAQVPSLALMRERFQDFVGGQVVDTAPRPRRSLDRRMLNDAINEIEAELNLIERVLAVGDSPAIEEPALFVEDEVTEPEPQVVADATQQVLERLRTGVAIEINLNGKPSRARLNWVSPTASSLVLSIDGDDKPSALSVRLFLRLLDNGRARFLEAAPLFERAVQSLLESADKLDKLDPGARTSLGMAA